MAPYGRRTVPPSITAGRARPRFVKAQGYAGGPIEFARASDGRVWTSDSRASGRMYAMPDIAGIADAAVPGPAYGARISNRISGMISLDRDGTLWNVTQQSGLLRVRSVSSGENPPAPLDEYTARDGLSSDQINMVYEDREGSLWVATDLGLDRFRRPMSSSNGVSRWHRILDITRFAREPRSLSTRTPAATTLLLFRRSAGRFIASRRLHRRAWWYVRWREPRIWHRRTMRIFGSGLCGD